MPRLKRTFITGALLTVSALVVFNIAPSQSAPTTQLGQVHSKVSAAGVPTHVDDREVELGLSFEPKAAGIVRAIRFYQAPTNAGSQVGTLWDSSGSAIATARGNSSPTGGWQQLTFDRPVRVSADRRYVVSYHAKAGGYAAQHGFFEQESETSLLRIPAGAGVYAYGPTTFPKLSYRNTSYYIDVVFDTDEVTAIASPTAAEPKPEATQSDSAQTVSDLPLAAGFGGPAYWEKFPKARAAGWTDPKFFPIAVFFGKPSQTRELKALGINTFMGAEHDGSSMSTITSEGMMVIAQPEWTSAEVGDDPLVVGWHASDECDMGLGGCDGGDEYHGLAIQRGYVADLRAKQDGRFVQANFGNGVLGSSWSPNTMDDHLALVDLSSVDKYAYTSPHVQELIESSPHWTAGTNPASSRAYGWQERRMQSFMSPQASKPNWVFVETARPFLTEAGSRTITPVQIRGAVWNALINGAAGITYFQHNNNGECGTYSLVECSAELRSSVQAVNAEVQKMAPVLNSPTRVWDFGPGLETNLKQHDDSVYIFAMSTGQPGDRSFKLPPGTTGNVTVVGENRSIVPKDGQFQDAFGSEHEHHIYRIDLA